MQPALRTLEALGDPWGKEGPPSNGPGSRGGIGSGDEGGVGPGDGRGAGPGEKDGITSTVYRAVDGVTLPQLIHKVEPEFTDEARKARHQGGVLLRVIVGPDGLVRRVELLKAVGLGLDERAIDAVRQWRFRPGTKNGRPVSVEAEVEVTFRLL
jgi:TonB family protein